MQSSDLNRAIQLIKSGEKIESQKILAAILVDDAQNIQAWFWYVETWSTIEMRIKALEFCLKQNPENENIKQLLAKLKAKNDSEPDKNEDVELLVEREQSGPSISKSKLLKIALFSAVAVLFIALAILIVPLFNRTEQGAVLLGLNLEEGKTYTERITGKSTVTSLAGIIPSINTMETGYEFKYYVEGIKPNGDLQIRVTFDWVLSEARIFFFKVVSYDSSKPPSRITPEIAGSSALHGKSFLLIVSPQGELREIIGADEVLEQELAKISDEETRSSIAETLGKDAITDIFVGAFPRYPKTPVKVGDSWQVEYEIGTGLPTNVICSYRLEKRKNGIATISNICDLELKDNAQLDGSPISGPGQIAGTYEVDETSGWFIKGEAKQELTLTMSEGDTGLDIPIRWKGNIKIDKANEPP